MNKNKGVFLAFLTAMISGFAVFFNKFAMSFWTNSSVFTTAKNLIAVLFLVSLLLLLGKIKDLKKLSKKQWFQLVVIGFVGGSVPFLLFFKGLSLSSSISAAFIHKTLFVWVALMAVFFLKEKISSLQFLAIGVLFTGVYLSAGPFRFHLGYAELLIFLATLLWAIENVIAKKILKDLSSLTVAWARMFFGSMFLLAFLVFSGGMGALEVSSWSQIGWLFFSGLLLFGYVITWYSALKRAPATVVTSILVLAVPITALLNNKVLILPTALMVFGVFLICGLFKKLKIINSFKIKNLKLKI